MYLLHSDPYVVPRWGDGSPRIQDLIGFFRRPFTLFSQSTTCPVPCLSRTSPTPSVLCRVKLDPNLIVDSPFSGRPQGLPFFYSPTPLGAQVEGPGLPRTLLLHLLLTPFHQPRSDTFIISPRTTNGCTLTSSSSWVFHYRRVSGPHFTTVSFLNCSGTGSFSAPCHLHFLSTQIRTISSLSGLTVGVHTRTRSMKWGPH